ncbi:MAG: pyridoxal phosphate-dependent aminotransferase [Sphaerobacteraceae bacterium]|nr:MAG: pyridoxal phosphate-dependent aminotransferase [Sphaerobacteraceae bacterium]
MARASREMQASGRASQLPASPIRRLAPLAEAAKERGIHVHHLNIGQPDLAPPESITRLLERASGEELVYAPARGASDAVSAWQIYYSHHSVDLEREDMLITAGASEALMLALLTTCDPGDDVLLPEPFYAPYKGLLSITGLNPIPIPSGPDFAPPDADVVRSLVTPNTRAMLICSPSNPTGTVYGQNDLEKVGAVAVENDFFLLSDETYREIVFDGPAAPSALAIPGLEECAVVIDSVSKRFNVCGLRIGCLASRNRAVIDAALEIAELRLAVPMIDQRAVVSALTSPRPYVDTVVEAYRERKDAVVNALRAIPGVVAHPPGGAFYVVADLPVDDAEAFSAWMLREIAINDETVMLTPMIDFYATPGTGTTQVRIACVYDAETLTRAISIVGKALEDYPGRTG